VNVLKKEGADMEGEITHNQVIKDVKKSEVYFEAPLNQSLPRGKMKQNSKQ